MSLTASESDACEGASSTTCCGCWLKQHLHPVTPEPDAESHTQALVICATSESARRIERALLCGDEEVFRPDVVLVCGAAPIEADRHVLADVKRSERRAPLVVVGTPARLRALLLLSDLKLEGGKQVLLADSNRLLQDPGPRHDLRRILDNVPVTTRLVAFGVSSHGRPRDSIKELVQDNSKAIIDPPLASPGCQCSPDSSAYLPGRPQLAGGCRSPTPDDQDLLLKATVHQYLRVSEADKPERFVALLDSLDFQQVAVFTKSAERALAVGKMLVDCGVPTIVINEGLDKDEQISRYGQFRDFHKRVLVATDLDLFNRGVDVKRVDVIINYDVPSETSVYSRRAGHVRGSSPKDVALTLVSEDQDMAELLRVRQCFGVSLEELCG